MLTELTRTGVLMGVMTSPIGFSLLGTPLGRVSERVVIDGTPQQGVPRRVILLRITDAQVVGQQLSAADGGYAFEWVDASAAHVPLAIDHLGVYEAVAAGPVMPVLRED